MRNDADDLALAQRTREAREAWARAQMTPEQRELAAYMVELSEKACCAYWMRGLEHALWDVRCGIRLRYGDLDVTDEHRDKLKRLSAACGGWIVWRESGPHGGGETWVSLDDWHRRLAAICEAKEQRLRELESVVGAVERARLDLEAEIVRLREWGTAVQARVRELEQELSAGKTIEAAGKTAAPQEEEQHQNEH